MTDMAEKGIGLWDEEDGFYYAYRACRTARNPPQGSLAGGADPALLSKYWSPNLAEVPEFAARLPLGVGYPPGPGVPRFPLV